MKGEIPAEIKLLHWNKADTELAKTIVRKEIIFLCFLTNLLLTIFIEMLLGSKKAILLRRLVMKSDITKLLMQICWMLRGVNLSQDGRTLNSTDI